MRIGVISDTHGLLRPEALDVLRGSDHIIHAGDIGSPEVLAALQGLAPVTAVRGNNDRAGWAQGIPETATLTLAGHRIHVLHDIAELVAGIVKAPIRVVIAGHSHKPRSEVRDGVLFFNPGSAGPRRFRLPITVGRIALVDGELVAEVIALV